MIRKETDLIIHASQTLRNRPIFWITLDNKPTNWWEKLRRKLKPEPNEIEYAVSGTMVDSTLIISELTAQIPPDVIHKIMDSEGNVAVGSLLPVYHKYMPVIMQVIAVAIQNDGKEADTDLVKKLIRNFDNNFVLEAFRLVCAQWHMQDFTNTITLALNQSVLPRVSQKD